jgi:hypothetical protein
MFCFANPHDELDPCRRRQHVAGVIDTSEIMYGRDKYMTVGTVKWFIAV